MDFLLTQKCKIMHANNLLNLLFLSLKKKLGSKCHYNGKKERKIARVHVFTIEIQVEDRGWME